MPAFPDYAAFAETEEEALKLAHEGIVFELEHLREQGQVPPTEPSPPKVVLVAA